MKAKAIQLLISVMILSEKFNQLLAIFQSHPQRNRATEIYFNRVGYTPQSLETLEYEVKKAFNISDLELKQEEIRIKNDGSGDDGSGDDGSGDDGSCDDGSGDPNANKNPEKETGVKTDLASELNTKLRDDFPFLDNDDCPNELKILVADKLTAYRKYKEARKQLELNAQQTLDNGDANHVFNKLSDDEVKELSKLAVEKFELNQVIYNELNYYKETGTVLGKHIIFKTLKLQEALNAMDGAELQKRKGLVQNYISKKKKSLKTTQKQKAQHKLQTAIDVLTLELDLINKKLG